MSCRRAILISTHRTFSDPIDLQPLYEAVLVFQLVVVSKPSKNLEEYHQISNVYIEFNLSEKVITFREFPL